MKKELLIKRELARTLQEMSLDMPLSSVTVTALTRKCGISRGTFYYHFIDIYDLINWIFDTEIIAPLQAHINENKQNDWSGITRYCLEKMYENKSFYCNAIQFEGQNNLRDHMQEKNLESWQLLIHKYCEESGHSQNIDNLPFLIRYTSQAVCSMVINWALNGMTIPPETMALMDDVATLGIYGIINKFSSSS